MKNLTFLIVLTLISACHFNSDPPKIPARIKKAAEKKFGAEFNKTRDSLGLQILPANWKVVYNDDYQLYFGEKLDSDSLKEYVFKIIEYDKDLNILSEEDFYRPAGKTRKPSNEDCEEVNFSMVYRFKEHDYSFRSACCEECGALGKAWENTPAGNKKKLLELLKANGIPAY